MSYSSVLEIGTYGQLGEQRTSSAFPAVALNNNFYTPISNNVNLSVGAWLLTTRITVNPNADNTSVITRLQMNNRQVVFNDAKYTQSLIWNDSGSVAYTTTSVIFTTQAIIIISNPDRGAYNTDLYWLGGGSAPTATASITATKLI